jgi:hypothetical protein
MMIGKSEQGVEMWASYHVTDYSSANRGRSTRIKLYDGPESNAILLNKADFNWSQRVEELSSANKRTWSILEVYELWSTKFGELKDVPTCAEIREQLAPKKRTKKRLLSGDSAATEHSAKTMKTTKTTEASNVSLSSNGRIYDDSLDDEALRTLWYQLDAKISPDGCSRLAEMLQSKQGLASPPPVELITRVREEAKNFNRTEPKMMWQNSLWTQFLRNAPRKAASFMQEVVNPWDARKALDAEMEDFDKEFRETCEQLGLEI